MSKEPKDTAQFSPIGFAIGLPLGFPIAMALDNLAFFPVFGVLFGIVFAAALGNKKDTVDDNDNEDTGPS